MMHEEELSKWQVKYANGDGWYPKLQYPDMTIRDFFGMAERVRRSRGGFLMTVAELQVSLMMMSKSLL